MPKNSLDQMKKPSSVSRKILPPRPEKPSPAVAKQLEKKKAPVNLAQGARSLGGIAGKAAKKVNPVYKMMGF